MERAEIIACRANGEDIFFEFSSNSQLDKKCLAFRGSLQFTSKPDNVFLIKFSYNFNL